ncbi:MAG: hypothetical protein H0U70_07835 [Tatlockia sp.]|nr:hypothetical protein [Tatlockia sp.]
MRYLYPAEIDDLLKVTTTISNKKSCSDVFDQSIRNQHNTQLCKAKIKVVCIDNQIKPRRLPEIFLIVKK